MVNNLIANVLTAQEAIGLAVGFFCCLGVLVACIIVAAVKRVKNTRRRYVGTSRSQHTDNNLSSYQRVYTESRERKETMKMSEEQQRYRPRANQTDCDDAYHTHEGNKVVANSDGHSHSADSEERYEKIVGSLGEVDDEGCLDLDGVRLIVEDIAYSDKTETRDYTEIAKAVVLGDVINNPRFKTNSRKR